MRKVPSLLFGNRAAAPKSPRRMRSMPEDTSIDEEAGSSSSKLQFEGECVVVAYRRLPIISSRVDGKWQFCWHSYGYGKRIQEDTLYILACLQKTKFRIIWVGCLDVYVEPEEREDVEAYLLQNFDCVPVFPEQELYRKYKFFCKNYLSPLFHHSSRKVVDAVGVNDPQLWRSFIAVNRLFANAIIGVLNAGDIVWLHDHELALVPTNLIRRVSKNPITLFMHSPFPSSEIYRTLPMREELLRGMLNCDLVAFHMFDYARHFLTCASRLLGAAYELEKGGFLGVKFQGRHVMVRSAHAGVHVSEVVRLHADPRVKQEKAALLEETGAANKTVFVGYDDLNDIKGIPNKLLAFQKLLMDYPVYRDKVVFIQISVPSEDDPPESSLSEDCHQIRDSINNQFPNSCFYIEDNISVYRRHALWSMCDVIVNTSLRSGLALTPHEFILCCKSQEAGVILSEFVACSRDLGGCLQVNPFSFDSIVSAIDKYMSMPAAERARRLSKMRDRVERGSIQQWAESLLLDAKRAHRESGSSQSKYLSIGLGLNMRSLNLGTATHLEPEYFLKQFSSSMNRLIIIDTGSGFSGGVRETDLGADSPIVQTMLTLAANERNTLYLITSHNRDDLRLVFRDNKEIGLAAEHGFYLKHCNADEWKEPFSGVNVEWKEVCLPLLKSYTERTAGSFIDETYSTLIWDYADSDPDFGTWQAKALMENLTNDLRAFPARVELHAEHKCVEISPTSVTKSELVAKIVQNTRKNVDFALYLDDGAYDADACRVVADACQSPGQCFTVSLGLNPGSGATYFLYDLEEALQIFRQLQSSSLKSGFSHSMGNLQAMVDACGQSNDAFASPIN
eukprot:Rmarinus@m.26564